MALFNISSTQKSLVKFCPSSSTTILITLTKSKPTRLVIGPAFWAPCGMVERLLCWRCLCPPPAAGLQQPLSNKSTHPTLKRVARKGGARLAALPPLVETSAGASGGRLEVG